MTLVPLLSSAAMHTWIKTPNQVCENVPSTSLHSVCSGNSDLNTNLPGVPKER